MRFAVVWFVISGGLNPNFLQFKAGSVVRHQPPGYQSQFYLFRSVCMEERMISIFKRFLGLKCWKKRTNNKILVKLKCFNMNMEYKHLPRFNGSNSRVILYGIKKFKPDLEV